MESLLQKLKTSTGYSLPTSSTNISWGECIKSYSVVFSKQVEKRPQPLELFHSIGMILSSLLNDFNLNNMEQLQLILRMFELLRNLCAGCNSNQINCLKSEPNLIENSIKLVELMGLSENGLKACRMGIQFFSNLMTENQIVQVKLWNDFVSSNIILRGISSSDSNTRHSTLVWIYNCTHGHPELTEKLCKSKSIYIVSAILKHCEKNVNEHENIDFELGISIMTSILETDFLPCFWSNMDINDCISLLKCLDGVVHLQVCPSYMKKTWSFMIQLFQQQIQQIDLSSDSLILHYTIQYWNILSGHNIPVTWLELTIPLIGDQ